MSQSNKNAYEIRLEVLSLAMSQADSVWHAELTRRQIGAEAGDKKYELPDDTRVRDTLKIAKKLYAFVEGDAGKDFPSE